MKERRLAEAGAVIIITIILVMAVHYFQTGSPIPLWHIERLNNASRVAGFTTNRITLEDGRTIHAPELTIIPSNITAMLLEHGVEIGTNGDVCVLAVHRASCGNSPYVYVSRRTTLRREAAFWIDVRSSVRPAERGAIEHSN